MTFSERVKNEISESKLNELENRNLLLGYLYVNADFSDDKMKITLENMTIAKKLFKTFKFCYNASIKMTVRTIKRFRAERVFIFEVNDKREIFADELKMLSFPDLESKHSFIKGIFLASGSISDPQKGGYHLEMTFPTQEKAEFVLEMLKTLGYSFKMIKRDKNYMLYIKVAEDISDFLKMLGTINSLFYFEDIRIYRDHKNMVNRLNNCEQANYEKSLSTSMKQVEEITFLKDNDYFSLLDDKTKLVAEYRLKYPEESFQMLSSIISSETDMKVSKSFINHHFRKINEIYNRIISKTDVV